MRVDVMQHYGFTQPLSHAGYYETAHHRRCIVLALDSQIEDPEIIECFGILRTRLQRALQMILTAEPIDARQAESVGLVNRVVEHTALLSEARLLADQIARHSPAGVAACLRSVTRGLNVSIDEGLAIEATQFAAMVATPDIRRGIDAFLTRRKG